MCLARTHYDVDVAAKLLEAILPLTYAEAEASYEQARGEGERIFKPVRDSVGDRLRKVLGIEREISLLDAIEIAIIRLERVQS